MMKSIAKTLKPLACWALALGLFAAPAWPPGRHRQGRRYRQAAADTAAAAPAAEAAAPPVTRALMARVADLEAYINNTAPAKLTGVPGPGHNGWMMIWPPWCCS